MARAVRRVVSLIATRATFPCFASCFLACPAGAPRHAPRSTATWSPARPRSIARAFAQHQAPKCNPKATRAGISGFAHSTAEKAQTNCFAPLTREKQEHPPRGAFGVRVLLLIHAAHSNNTFFIRSSINEHTKQPTSKQTQPRKTASALADPSRDLSCWRRRAPRRTPFASRARRRARDSHTPPDESSHRGSRRRLLVARCVCCTAATCAARRATQHADTTLTRPPRPPRPPQPRWADGSCARPSCRRQTSGATGPW